MTNRTRRGILALGSAVLWAAMGTGCFFSQGGSGASRDTHTYDSTAHFPKTVSVIDTRTDQALWTMEIPVGQRLVVRFAKGESEDPNLPDVMRWELMTQDTFFGSLDNSMPVPPSDVRLLQVDLRESPEMATGS